MYVSNDSIPDEADPPPAFVLETEEDIMEQGDFRLCGSRTHVIPSNQNATIQCDEPLVGRYLLVFKVEGYPINAIALCEVLVYGHPYVGKHTVITGIH